MYEKFTIEIYFLTEKIVCIIWALKYVWSGISIVRKDAKRFCGLLCGFVSGVKERVHYKNGGCRTLTL